MRAILALAAATCGCTYHGRGLTSDAAPGAADAADDAANAADGPTAADAAVDALVTSCDLRTDDSQLDTSGQAGGDGGGLDLGMSIECDRPDDVIVGISVRISDAVIFYGGQSALAIDITCAPVTIRSDGTASVGTSYTHEATGNGAQGWSPATPTAVALCPTDAVVNALDVHTGTSGHLLQNVTVGCAQIGPAGAPTGTTTQVFVNGSLTDANGDDPVTCASNHVLRRLEPRDGSGLDAVILRCAPIACAP